MSIVNYQQPDTTKKRISLRYLLSSVVIMVAISYSGCAVKPKTLSIKDNPMHLTQDTILQTETMSEIYSQELLHHLTDTRVIYVGENHRNPAHHAIQLTVIKALSQNNPDLTIGMEMFDHTYQPVLDQWTAGEISETTFIAKSHWYANWRFDYGLYRDILEFAKEKGIRIIALNVPFHIPGKISVGGIISLSEEDRRHLPDVIYTNETDHRAYVEEIFSMHTIRGRNNFDYFYEAQCTWEDAMAEAIADNLGSGKMVVLVGNGHIIKKFGVPNRAFGRNGASFNTIYTVSVGAEADPAWGDFLWVTQEPPMPRMGMSHGKIKK